MSARRPLPVTIISGYLGSGKTTLINRLLAAGHGKRLAVLVNDFGEIAIDEELIVNRTGETIALTNGCMCCSIGGDLYDAIDRIIRNGGHDHLVIETSGVADPGKVLQIALAEPDLDPFGVVALADMANLRQLLADPYLDDTLRRQIASARLVLLTKGDLCDRATMEEAGTIVENLVPGAMRLFAENGDVPFELLLSRISHDGRPQTPAGPRRGDHTHEHAGTYRSWAFSGAATVSDEALERFVRSDDLGIYRLKGFARLACGTIVEVHRAGRTWSIRRRDNGATDTRLVAIGPITSFSPESIQARWLETLG